MPPLEASREKVPSAFFRPLHETIVPYRGLLSNWTLASLKLIFDCLKRIFSSLLFVMTHQWMQLRNQGVSL